MESGKELMRQEAKQLVQECGPMPMLVSYSCDGTLCKDVVQNIDFERPRAKAQQESRTGQGQRRKGRQDTEVMVEH
eukprot:10808176-Lingulodinium_polyedra.AAC.1